MSKDVLVSGDGKDLVIFVTSKDHAIKSKVELPELESTQGLILPNGEINWLCPCLDGLATGPCGIPFRKAFACFHVSKADPKGSDCVNAFKVMQDCMTKFPKIYKNEEIPKSALTKAEEMEQAMKDAAVAKNKPCKAAGEVKK